MPDPRQQDHKLNKDELVTYTWIFSRNGRGTEWRSFLSSPTFFPNFVTIESMWYFQERF